MGGGSEREREWLGEMISNKMPVFRNIGPLATAFGWSFLPPNYVLIKYHLSFDTSTENQLLKFLLSFQGGEDFGWQAAVHEHLGVPRIMGILCGKRWSLWGRWCKVCFSEDMGCFVWPGLLDMLLHVLVLGATSCCAPLGCQECSLSVHPLPSPSPLCWDELMAWWVHSDCSLGNLKSYLKY